MRTWIRIVMALFVLSIATARFTSAQAQEQTWTGKISDSMCNVDHKDNGGTMQKDHDCTLKCVKSGNQFVFVNGADKKIYKIADQKMADLTTHAGHTVQVTGTMKGDTITVSKVVMPPAK